MAKDAWTRAQLSTLRRLYPDNQARAVAAKVEHSLSQVYAMAYHLGLRKSEAFLASPKSGRLRKGVAHSGKAWTRAEKRTLRTHYPDKKASELARLLDRPEGQIHAAAQRFGLKKSAEFLASERSGRLVKGRADVGAATRFRKGNVPWTKGKKGLHFGPQTEFKKGIVAHNRMPVGTIVMATIGYLKVKVGEPRTWRWVHRLVWEEMNGPIPKGMMLIFKDGNRENVEPENLKLITKQEHMARYTIANYPPELRSATNLLGRLKRKIEERHEKQD